MINNSLINNLSGILESGVSISINIKEIEKAQMSALLAAAKKGNTQLILKLDRLDDLDVHEIKMAANNYQHHLKLDILN